MTKIKFDDINQIQVKDFVGSEQAVYHMVIQDGAFMPTLIAPEGETTSMTFYISEDSKLKTFYNHQYKLKYSEDVADKNSTWGEFSIYKEYFKDTYSSLVQMPSYCQNITADASSGPEEVSLIYLCRDFQNESQVYYICNNESLVTYNTYINYNPNDYYLIPKAATYSLGAPGTDGITYFLLTDSNSTQQRDLTFYQQQEKHNEIIVLNPSGFRRTCKFSAPTEGSFYWRLANGEWQSTSESLTICLDDHVGTVIEVKITDDDVTCESQDVAVTIEVS